MLYISADNSIKLTRGDTARLTVSVTNDQSQAEYVMDENDILTLTVKKKTTDTTSLIEKIATGGNQFCIEPTDTSGLAFGAYKYDVQLTTAGGDVYTIIEPSTFEILAEVTY